MYKATLENITRYESDSNLIMMGETPHTLHDELEELCKLSDEDLKAKMRELLLPRYKNDSTKMLVMSQKLCLLVQLPPFLSGLCGHAERVYLASAEVLNAAARNLLMN